jgi:pimeloyl-ACP methyl ester carboxylesterase
MARTTTVLVHGAWHGAWCWDRVVERAAGAGASVVAVDLPGHGLDTGPLSDLHGDATRVREVLDTLEPPVILLGHSYGGAVITEAGDHPSVRRLVYLSALALDDGESCGNAAADEVAAAMIVHDGRPDIGAGFVVGDDGIVTLLPSVAAACLYNDCDEASIAWALARIGPHPLVALQQSPTSVAWRSKPSTYIVCVNDLTVHPDLQRIFAKRCTTTEEWESGHSPFLSQPDRLAGLVLNLSNSRRSDV